MSICNQPVGQLGSELVSCHPCHTLCQLPAPTDVGSAMTKARMLRHPAHPLLRVQNQAQRMGERKAEDCLGLPPAFHMSPGRAEDTVIHLECDHLEIQPVLCTLSGAWMGDYRHGLKQGPLPGAAEALLGHKLHKMSSCPFNLECHSH